MKASSRTEKHDRFRFRTEHFYQLLESQKYTCPVSGRVLTPQNTVAEHRIPLRKNGQHALSNIILVDEQISKIKRYLTDEEVVKLAADIINALGKEYGYAIKKAR